MLKRLADAVADGDTFYAVIRGSAINNDGAAEGRLHRARASTARPQVIAEALAMAGVAPDTIGYVEAHGTGTALGDPVEDRGAQPGVSRKHGGRSEAVARSSKI